MSRKVRNILLILGVAVLSAEMLMGCGKSAERKSAEKEFQEMGFSKEEAEEILELAGEFADDVAEKKEEESKAEKEEDITGLEICECMISDKDVFYDVEIQYLDMVFTPGMTYEDVVNTISNSKFAKYIKLEDSCGGEVGPSSHSDYIWLNARDEDGFELDFDAALQLNFNNSIREDISSGCVIALSPFYDISDYVWLSGGISNATIKEWDYDKCTSWAEACEKKRDGVGELVYGVGDEIYSHPFPYSITCDGTGHGEIIHCTGFSAIRYNNSIYKDTDFPRY